MSFMSKLAKITWFFTENKYFKCVWEIIIQKQIIYTNSIDNIYKFITILSVRNTQLLKKKLEKFIYFMSHNFPVGSP